MTSLSEVYDGVGETSLRRLYLGTALFVVGAGMVVIAIVIASTDLLAAFGVGTFGAREIAGILAGFGVPAVFVGIFTVLPARRYERATAAIGATIAIFGVILFWDIYPEQWYGATTNHYTLPVVAVYFIGTLITFWSLFTAVVNFKTRNDPGGTVTLKRTIDGETKLVEVPVSELEGREVGDIGSAGGVGVLGDVDRSQVMAGDGDTTTDDAEVLSESSNATRSTDRGGNSAASDGGTATTKVQSPARDRDRYCGNCTFFDYKPTDAGIEPHCGYHNRLMDDMEPCQHWEPNTPR